MKKKDFALVANLFTGRKAMVEPDYATKKCAYRYLTDSESEGMKLDVNGKHIWLETPIYSSIEDGVTRVFVTIDATPIVLNTI